MTINIPRIFSSRIVFCTVKDNPEIVARILAFRKRVLVDHLSWNLRVVDGLERDEFDTEHAVYCAIFDSQNIISTFRLIRTDRPYLARTKFPQLAVNQPYPADPRVWEISRLAVDPHTRPFETMLLTYAAVFHFAIRRGARSLVAFAEVAKERLVTRIGIRTDLLGPPVMIGHDLRGRPIVCVAGELPLAIQGGPRFEKLLSRIEQTEIEDGAALLGRTGIPARSALTAS